MEALEYRKCGEYLLPVLELDGEGETEEMPLGKYGMLRQSFLMEHHRGDIYAHVVDRAAPAAPAGDRQAGI